MRIGYAKLGRSWNLDVNKASGVGGDLDAIRLLRRLSTDRPDDVFVLVGKNSGEDPQSLGYASNIVNPWKKPSTWHVPGASQFGNYRGDRTFADSLMEKFRAQTRDLKLDAFVVWLGQHGNANSYIPQIGHDWDNPAMLAHPQVSMFSYCFYLMDMVNRSGIEPIFLCPDPRNYLKGREFTNVLTRPILGQFDMVRPYKHERFNRWDNLVTHGIPGRREQSVWVTDVRYEYAGVELTALRDTSEMMTSVNTAQEDLGILVNENQVTGPLPRKELLKKWVLPYFPNAQIFGTWTKESQTELGRVITPVAPKAVYETLRRFKTTITFPASSSGWATAKPWECFAVGTLCFFHPKYDTQGHILPLPTSTSWASTIPEARELAGWLRVASPEQFVGRVKEVTQNPELYRHLVALQWTYFAQAFSHWQGGARRIHDYLNDPQPRVEPWE